MSNLDQNTVDEITKFVETLPDAIYPTDVFLPLTKKDEQDIKSIHVLFPNLLSRISARECRRTYFNTANQIKERFEDNE